MKTSQLPAGLATLLGLLAAIGLGFFVTLGPTTTSVSSAQQVYGVDASKTSAGVTYQVVPQPGGVTQVFLFDPAAQRLCVYHVDPNTGAIALKGVRNVSFDVQMMQFNSENPSPQDVRAGLPPQ